MSSPIYWIDGPWPGGLGILPRPRGGDWLDVDIRSWQKLELDTVVSLLMPQELTDLNLRDEAAACKKQAIELITFGIPDRGVPQSLQETSALVQRLYKLVSSGCAVALHCRQGIGRSGLVAGCLLVAGGIAPTDALVKVSRIRGCEIPETDEQREWCLSFAANL